MFKILTATLLFSLITFSQAFDEGNVIDTPVPKKNLLSAKPFEEKSSGWAYGLSFIGTVVPVTSAVMISNYAPEEFSVISPSLIGLGIFMGPSLGQFYAESYGTGLLGFGIRSTGFLLVGLGAIQAINSVVCGMENAASKCKESSSDGGTLILLGMLTYVGGVVYSFLDIPKSLERYRIRKAEEPFSLIPSLSPTPSGQLRYGIASTLHF